jgi:hypothetical protein
MKPWLRLALAVVAGFVVGSVVNMALIMVSGKVIAPPPGADVTTADGLKASLRLFEPRHFVFPFLAHALGTFAGALAAAWWTPGRTPGPAYAVGGLFLLAGIANVAMLPAPLWFSALDLIVAYLPMAWLAHRLVSRA